MDLENKHWEITDGQNNGSENSIEWEMEYKVSRSGKHCESMEKEVNSGDVGVNSAGESRMVSRARQGFVEDESRSKTKLKEVGDGMEGKIDHRDSRN